MSITPRGIDASYDYIIIGAGSAGCALASRLSREASRRVLLLEAGGPDRHPMIHVPLGFAFLMKDKSVNWCYQTEPEPELNYRKIAWPRGKVVGGSSAITRRASVDLPEPDSPTTPRLRPACSVKLRPCTARTSGGGSSSRSRGSR